MNVRWCTRGGVAPSWGMAMPGGGMMAAALGEAASGEARAAGGATATGSGATCSGAAVVSFERPSAIALLATASIAWILAVAAAAATAAAVGIWLATVGCCCKF